MLCWRFKVLISPWRIFAGGGEVRDVHPSRPKFLDFHAVFGISATPSGVGSPPPGNPGSATDSPSELQRMFNCISCTVSSYLLVLQTVKSNKLYNNLFEFFGGSLEVTLVVDWLFLPQNFGPVVETYEGLLRLCEWTFGGDCTSRWWGHISTICHHQSFFCLWWWGP